MVNAFETVVLLVGVWASAFEMPRADLGMLREAGAPTEGPALLAWLRGRLPADDDADRLADLVPQLGDRRFAVRDRATTEIIALGPKAIPELKRANADSNAEVRNRARLCLRALEMQIPLWPNVAMRLREEHPPGTIAALLRWLPLADEDTEDAIQAALFALSRQGGRIDSLLLEALGDTDALKRSAAALVVGQARQPSARGLLRPLLKDAEPKVRLQAALGLLLCGERSAAALLPELLEVPAVAERATTILEALAGTNPPSGAASKSVAERRKAWLAYCRDHADTFETAALTELLPGQNMASRAKKAAEKFIACWQGNDGPGLLAISSAPFFSAGQMLATPADLNKAWGKQAPGPQHAYHFRFHRLLSTSKGLAFCQGEAELAAVKGLRPAEHRIMIYSPTPNSWGLIVIRVKGGRVTVAGLTVDRGGDPPN